jgi:hypothetical protein
MTVTSSSPESGEQLAEPILDLEQSLDAMAQDLLAEEIPEEVPSADDGNRIPSRSNEDVGFTIDDFAAGITGSGKSGASSELLPQAINTATLKALSPVNRIARSPRIGCPHSVIASKKPVHWYD